jgi:hypothetical protein
MLQQLDPASSVLVTECNLSVTSGVSVAGGDRLQVSPVTLPVPLVCPFQHLHTWQPPEGQGHAEFKQGQFKVIMMDGVIYR